MTATIERRLFTVHEYAIMREAGILHEDDRVELLDGEIITMSPIGPLHVSLVNRLTTLLVQLVGSESITSVQNPIRLNEYGEPQPDLVLLSPRADYYADAIATPDDVLLVVEVADSSLEYDRDTKVPRYAQAGISEVWILDVARRTMIQYTQPADGRYDLVREIAYGATIQSTLLPKIQITTEKIWG
jgi:Uma2 family endonuclease